VSFRAVLFFSLYIFGIWFYSHKLKKYLFVGNLTAAILAVIPFFAVFIYYKNFDLVIFVHATFLFLLISMREVVKDLENLKGDLVQNYLTIPVVYGERVAKQMLTILAVLTLFLAALLIVRFDIGWMWIYFTGSILAMLVFLVVLWMANSKIHYLGLHVLIKAVIVIGVFSIVLIDVDLLLNRFSRFVGFIFTGDYPLFT
jgi:4-hydroxybenzoate polyprenyltransferase